MIFFIFLGAGAATSVDCDGATSAVSSDIGMGDFELSRDVASPDCAGASAVSSDIARAGFDLSSPRRGI